MTKICASKLCELNSVFIYFINMYFGDFIYVIYGMFAANARNFVKSHIYERNIWCFNSVLLLLHQNFHWRQLRYIWNSSSQVLNPKERLYIVFARNLCKHTDKPTCSPSLDFLDDKHCPVLGGHWQEDRWCNQVEGPSD